MTKKKTTPAGSPGNIFHFYVPKPDDTAPVSGVVAPVEKPKPTPSAVVPPAGGKLKYPRPAAFIADNFVRTKKASFGAKGPLADAHVVQDVQIVRAALECGYGKRSNWTSALVLKPHEATGLANYLLLRLQMVAACIEADSAMAKVPRSFYARVEASEKTALSFILGGIGTYLAARKWLEAGGETLKAFLHAGIYAKALSTEAAQPPNSEPGSGKMPDYLVVSTNGNWHIFESKGGAYSKRWARIVEGLTQLANAPRLAFDGSTAAAPTTSVCVHTSMDSGQRLEVTAVDPPGENTPHEGVPEHNRQPIVVIEGVCQLLLLLETLEQFYALGDNIIPRLEVTVVGWRMATSSQFGGLLIGVPDTYIRRERDIRRRLAVYLAVTEVLWEATVTDLRRRGLEAFIAGVIAKLSANTAGPETVPIRHNWLRHILARIARHIGEAHFLIRCSEELKLNRVAKQVLPIPDQVYIRLTRDMPHAHTSGGLYLEQLERNKPPEGLDVAPLGPRG